MGTRMNGVSDFGYFWNCVMREGKPSLVSQPPKISLVVVCVSASSTPSFGSRNSVESSGDGQCVTVLLRVPLHVCSVVFLTHTLLPGTWTFYPKKTCTRTPTWTFSVGPSSRSQIFRKRSRLLSTPPSLKFGLVHAQNLKKK